MYIATSSSSSSLLSVSRVRFSSSLSRISAASFSPYNLSRVSAFPSSSKSSYVSVFNRKFRSHSFSSALRPLRCSAPRWRSHGVDRRNPVCLRSQARATSPVIECFERNIATAGMYFSSAVLSVCM